MPFHNFVFHDEKFDPGFFSTSSYEFPTFPDPPPLTGDPLFDEKETAFMSSFFDTVDQNSSFDHEFQDGLVQWTAGLDDLTKGLGVGDIWNTPTATNTTNNNYQPPSQFGLSHYESAVSEPIFPSIFPKPVQSQPLAQLQPQTHNPTTQTLLSHLHNSSHISNDLAPNVFANRSQRQQLPSPSDPMFSGYPSLNIPTAIPSGPPSAAQTPISTPIATHNLKQEASSPESPARPLPPRIAIPRIPSNYAPSSSSSTSPQPSKPPRKRRRENLSDQQKRMNHITSEQKRLNLIQQGFNEIHMLVPSLRGQRDRGESKSSVLLKTMDFILELREGNERLRRMLKR
jgi:hypothetical protein